MYVAYMWEGYGDGATPSWLCSLSQEELKALFASEHARLDREKAVRSADSAEQEEGGEGRDKGAANL